MKNWKYYNNAMIPTCAPHEEPDTTPVYNGEIWKNICGRKRPLLARWTTDFDCQEETNWWYVIKDTPFDLSALKAKRRYEITKGCKNFEIRRITNPIDYAEELYHVQIEAFRAYPEKYRPTVNKEVFFYTVSNWTELIRVYGAFYRETGQLCGYALLTCSDRHMNFSVQKTRPDSEKYGVNAALVYGILMDCQIELENGLYICDGARSVLHETAFQDYLEKYFGFRKAYCKLHIEYNPKVKWFVPFLYRFRDVFKKFDYIGLMHRINGVFYMQDCVK